MSILGLDVGDIRIGIAISEDLLFAHPFQTIERIGVKKDIQNLCRVVTEKDVETIVIGLPKRLNGEIGIQAEKVQGFSRRLEKNTKAKIVFWDERLTTVEAERIFQTTATNRKKRRKKVVDQIAAVLILEGYLSRFHRPHNLPNNA
ncbi:TPA: Holliday junction resolvase RuvX [Candidatus Poribacteria bacterium]|jgi:putative Holliday junction resolvase|nr:Holliday junction resolvase RuvX [Candidatus Poribacteria bacterium]HIB91405.1 Holliday junction resolvase RuvX [Candidatus Poribacteria bacterium]HIC00196.1 Holliday junction resolvase RuvX [Candidatus Poribacteria bacterium]HIC17241.1 Holliday junction resolvase RuvX [Candidatus Poribacteria bacterium]HIM12450.1 Holliday junction resolvase RuvX [Candidatus Poribacteria bacterium]